MMNVKSNIGVNQIGFWAVFILAGALAYRIVLHSDSSLLLFLGCVLAILIVVWRPVLGLAAYMVVYPMVRAGESLNTLKIGVFGLTILLLFIWLIQKFIKKSDFILKPEYRWLFLFFVFLSFSPLLGSLNNFTLMDWARDIAPLLNLLLLPVMVDYFGIKRGRWLQYLIFAGIGVGIGRDILVLLSRYGFSFGGLSVITSLPFSSLHPSLGFGLGLFMYLEKGPRKWLWLSLGIVSLGSVFLSPTRTVWITTVTMVLLIIAFSSSRRIWAITSMLLIVAMMVWLFFLSAASGRYHEAQDVRFDKLKGFSYDVSYQNRIEEMKYTAGLFRSSPLYGVGFGFQYSFWRPFVVGIGPGFFTDNSSHTDIMFFASKGGLVGLTLFGLMLYGIGKRLFQRIREKRNSLESRWATIALIALINCLIIGLSTTIFQTRSDAFALAILLAMGLGYKHRELNGSNPVSGKTDYSRPQKTHKLPG